jgi:hypothetical protein
VNGTRLLLAWLVVTAVTTVIAWQIVAAADDRIGEPPSRAIVAVDTSTTTATTPDPGDTTPGNTAGTDATSPTTSTVPEAPNPTTSATTSSTTSTTVPAAGWKIRTFQTAGGSVVVSYVGDQVRLDATLPAPGYSVEIDDEGPDRVEVEFVGEADEVEIRIERNDGVWKVDIDHG